MRRALVLAALRRGLSKRCPHCGKGPLFEGWSHHLERCSVWLITFVALGVLLIWTAPNRWGVGIALHYLSRVFRPDPEDPVPGSAHPPE